VLFTTGSNNAEFSWQLFDYTLRFELARGQNGASAYCINLDYGQAYTLVIYDFDDSNGIGMYNADQGFRGLSLDWANSPVEW